MALVSNWHRCLSHFCVELGLGGFFDHVLSSAEVGAEKPNGRIFMEACSRLGVPRERTVHVGDTYLDDYVGAESAGLQAVLVDRSGRADGSLHVVERLTSILDHVDGSDVGGVWTT